MPTSQKPLILISNDDGITARGIATLVDAVRDMGEVVVVAPDSPQSGMGHAITVHGNIKLRRSTQFGPDVEAYSCSGTPADCVKLAKHHVLRLRTPDIVLSGVNHGANSSISILYSGTMSAAMEANIEWVPAIGFSLDSFEANADFSQTTTYIQQITARVLADGLPRGIVLNVNFPSPNLTIKGIKVCRQADGFWREVFVQVPGSSTLLEGAMEEEVKLEGEFVNREPEAQDTDVYALTQGFVSVVPAIYDLTAHDQLATMRYEWEVSHLAN